MATHSSILAWTIPWTEEPVHGVAQELDTTEGLNNTQGLETVSAPLCRSFSFCSFLSLQPELLLRRRSYRHTCFCPEQRLERLGGVSPRCGHGERQGSLPLQLEHGPCWPRVSACSWVSLALEGGPLLPHCRAAGRPRARDLETA